MWVVKEGMIYDEEDGQTIASMSGSATPEQGQLIVDAVNAQESLLEIRKAMMEQDNRATAHPMYVVQEFGSGREHGHWKFVTVFFTNDAAEKFIDDNYHNYNNLRVYIASGWGNPEWQAVRALLRGDRKDV